MSSLSARALLALATIYLIWGSTYLAIRVMVETVPPLLGAGVRFFVAGLIFYAVLRLRRGAAAVRVTRAQVVGAGIVGTLLTFGGNGLVTVAEQAVPSALAALVIASVPLWIVVLRAVHGEGASRATVLSVGVGFAGVALLLLPGSQPEGAALWGIALIVLAAALWASGSFYSRRVELPPDALLATAYEMAIGGGLMVLVGLAVGEAGGLELAEVSLRSGAAFGYLIVFGSLGAFTAYVWLLQNVPISTVATYAYVNPLVAIVLGHLILSEEITSTMGIAAAVIIASVFVVVNRESAEAAEEAVPPPEPVAERA